MLTPISSLNGLQSFYSDFARVADDESRHLSWCLQRLEELGYVYGDMVAHSILWDGAQASSGESYALQLLNPCHTCLSGYYLEQLVNQSVKSSQAATCILSVV